MPQCKLHDAAPSLVIPEKRQARPCRPEAHCNAEPGTALTDSTAPILEVAIAAVPVPEPAATPLSASGKEHDVLASGWQRALSQFDTEDLGALQHREGLDRRTTTLRMRIEGLGKELHEVAEEYASLQTRDDQREAQRWKEHGALCGDASAHGKPLPPPPRTVAGHYDQSTALRGRDGKLMHRIHQQRGDRAPDWLPMLAAVLNTAGIAWQELSRPPTSAPAADEQTPLRQAVAAIKAVGVAARANWRPQYNLCTHADGTEETEADSVIPGGTPFNFSDRYGDEWRVHLARLDECDDARAPFTGPRINGQLSFDEEGVVLPMDYSDQYREYAITDAAEGALDPQLVESAVITHGGTYEEAIHTRWIRDRPNQPLSVRRLKEMVAIRARFELAKAALAVQQGVEVAPATPPAAATAAVFEDEAVL